MRIGLVLVAAALLGGCAGVRTGFLPFGAAPLAPREPGAAVGFYRGEPDRPHRDIGEILVEGGGLEDLEALRAALVRKAAAVGADAVKLVRVGFVQEEVGPWVYGGWYHGLCGYPGWGWYGGYPYPVGGARRIVTLRAIAVVWETPPAGA